MLIPFGILSAAGVVEGGATYELISTTILGGTAASVTFSNLGDYSSTYKHLQIRAVARMSNASNGATGSFRLNGDTGSNYAWHYLQGTGAAVQTETGTSDTEMENIYAITAANDVANSFGAVIIDILDCYSTTKNTTVRAFSGTTANETRARLGSGVWIDTASITSATMLSTSPGSFIANSRFSLYGIRG
jgi:hypothetical protein